MKAFVGTFNQEKALVGAFSVIVKSSFEALVCWWLHHYSICSTSTLEPVCANGRSEITMTQLINHEHPSVTANNTNHIHTEHQSPPQHEDVITQGGNINQHSAGCIYCDFLTQIDMLDDIIICRCFRYCNI